MRLLIILTLLIFPSTFIYGDSTNELPQNPTVAAGPAPTITTTGSGMTIHAPGSGILNWQSHNIGSNNYVNYNLNGPYMSRVTGGSPTAIWGQLNVQGGQFFLVNPNGIVFGPNSQINASGLLASSLDIKNQDFMSGKYRFYQNGRSAYVFNQGHITANNGNVVLLSNAVSNTGTITATLGHVALAAGSQVTVGLDDNSGISMAIGAADTSEVYGPDSKKINSAVLNAGSIIADGGKVTLDAQVLNKVFDHALNNTGVIQANTLVNHNGTVELVASGGNVVSSGPIVAHGGTITLDPEDITIQSGGAGSLIDPYDMFIDPVTLSSLDASEVHFQADRNIYINSPVDLNSTFTLEAKNDINVNANITTHGQNITLSADSDFDGMGSLNMAHGTLISSNGGDITLNSGSAMNIAFIDAGSGSVNLSSNSGTILDNGSFVSGGTVNLNAYNGIGPNAPIFTHAGQVNAVSQFNDIHISSNADLEAGQIHAVNGDVYLTADNGSILRSSSLITANNVFLNAFNSIGTETSPLEVDASTKINASTVNGGIDLSSPGDLAAGVINAAGGSADVDLVAGGAILGLNSYITADRLNAFAQTGIGTDVPLLTNVHSIIASSVTGPINIHNTGAVELVDITTNGAPMTISAGGTLTADYLNSGGGAIGLSGFDVHTTGLINTGGGALDLSTTGGGLNLGGSFVTSAPGTTDPATTSADPGTGAADQGTGTGQGNGNPSATPGQVITSQNQNQNVFSLNPTRGNFLYYPSASIKLNSMNKNTVPQGEIQKASLSAGPKELVKKYVHHFLPKENPQGLSPWLWALALLPVLFAPAFRRRPDLKVMARVGPYVITRDEFEEAYRKSIFHFKNTPESRQMFLNSMIGQKKLLLKQPLEDDSRELGPESAEFLKQNNAGNDA